MRIEEFEFEEEKTLSNLADLLVEIAEQIRVGNKLELPMPTLKEGDLKFLWENLSKQELKSQSDGISFMSISHCHGGEERERRSKTWDKSS